MHKLQTEVISFVMLTVTLATYRGSGAENWPQFRGPTGLGTTSEKHLPITWNGASGENVAWKTPLVGQGHASPIVWGDRVFVCTAHWPETVRRREEMIPEHHVLCYSTVDGQLLWDRVVPPGPWLRTDFRSGPGGGYACPTPTTDWSTVHSVRPSWPHSTFAGPSSGERRSYPIRSTSRWAAVPCCTGIR